MAGDRDDRNRRNLRPLGRVFPYLARYRGMVGAALFFLTLAAAATLSLPLAGDERHDREAGSQQANNPVHARPVDS